MICPDGFTRDEVAAFTLGDLPDTRIDDVASHLESCPACAAVAASLDRAASPLMLALRGADATPRRVGPYEVLEEAGRGGMGVVYKARHATLGRVVALKLMSGGSLADPALRERFLAEARAVARLEHPSIVRLLEAGEHGGAGPYLALEFVPGGSLSRVINGQPQPPARAAAWLEPLARAAHHAHEMGVVHRDIKPANVLLDAGGVPRLCDFGVARLAGVDRQTRSGFAVGTVEYMAPEQADGAAEPGPAADVYALGAVLYAALTGRPPFQASTPAETLALLLSQEPVAPRRLVPGVPRDLETVCLKCLKKDPSRRYASAAELADDLRRYLDGRPTRARPAGVVGRAAKWMKRAPSAAALVLLGGAIAFVGFPLVTVLWLDAAHSRHVAVGERGRADDLRQAAERREARLIAAQALELCDRGEVSRGLALLGDARDLADRLDGGEALGRAIRFNLDEWSGQQRRPGVTHAYLALSKAYGIAFSPDGETLALAGPYGVHLWDVEGKRQRRAMINPGPFWVPSPPNGLCFSADGSRIAATYDTGVVRLWDPKDGSPVGKPLPGGCGVAFHPGGRVIACATRQSIGFFDPATGEPLHSEPYPNEGVTLGYSPDGKHLAVCDYRGNGWLWPTDPGPAPAGEGRRPFRHAQTINSLAFDPRPGGRTLATASRDGTVRFWDVPTGLPRGRPLYHADEVGAVAWSDDGRFLLTGSKDLTARLWDADALSPVGEPWRLDALVLAARFGPGSKTCVLSTENGKVHFWHLPPVREPELALAHGWPVDQVAFWPDGGRMLTAGWSGALGWSPEGLPTSAFQTPRRLRHAAWALDAPALVTATWDQDVERWRVPPPVERLPPLRSGANQRVVQLALSPDGSIAYGVAEAARCVVRRWEMASGRELPGALRFGGAIARLALSREGSLLAAIVQRDGRSGVWVRSADDAGRGLFDEETPRCLAFSGDGRLAVGTRSGRVRLWDARAGRAIGWGDGGDLHRGEVLAVAFSPDGGTLLTGGTDGRARMWDVATGLPLGLPLPHVGPVLSVAFRDDGRAVLTGCQDGRAYRWRVPLGAGP